MYDLAELRAASEAWWRGLARAFRRHGLADVPDGLTRARPAGSIWRDPALLFAQTCGYPLTHGLEAHLRLVATPRYAAGGCVGAEYCSLIVVREDDPAMALAGLRGRTAAINSPESHSGWNVLRAVVAPLAERGRFFGDVITTGSHALSLAAVAGGAADVAAIDAVNHALLARHRPRALAGTRILERSPRAPGLPYVTSTAATPDTIERLRAGLLEALTDPALAACREALLIEGAEVLPRAAYDRILELAAAGACLRDGIRLHAG